MATGTHPDNWIRIHPVVLYLLVSLLLGFPMLALIFTLPWELPFWVGNGLTSLVAYLLAWSIWRRVPLDTEGARRFHRGGRQDFTIAMVFAIAAPLTNLGMWLIEEAVGHPLRRHVLANTNLAVSIAVFLMVLTVRAMVYKRIAQHEGWQYSWWEDWI